VVSFLGCDLSSDKVYELQWLNYRRDSLRALRHKTPFVAAMLKHGNSTHWIASRYFEAEVAGVIKKPWWYDHV
jgi:hypothetical protein